MEVPHSVAQERDPPAFVFRLLSFVLAKTSPCRFLQLFPLLAAFGN